MPLRHGSDRSAVGRRFLQAGRLAPEALERRDCPATVAIVGTGDVAETGRTTVLQVVLSEAVQEAVRVDYLLQGDATVGRDYRLAEGVRQLTSPTGTLTFKPGETTKRITVDILDDTLRETSERVMLSLFKPRGVTLAADKSATVSIIDDDSYTAEISGPTRLAEGATGDYVLRLSSPATKTETFYVNTADGLAAAGVDYRPLTKLPLVFGKGETQKAFRIQTLSDALPETDEFFFLEVTPASKDLPAVQSFGVTVAGIGPVPSPTVNVSDPTVIEGNQGLATLTFTVSLSAFTGMPVVVSYATRDGTATLADNDYAGVTSGTVTIPPGKTSASFSVFANGDTKVENDETFSVVLTAASNAVIGDSTATGTIVNDDSDAATGYQITLSYDKPSLPAAQKSVFERAVRRLQTLIVGDLPDVTVGNRVIDDMEVKVFVESMSPMYNGFAMATAWRPGTAGLPYQGEIHINSSRIGNPGIYHTIIHEMLHALGFYDSFFSQAGTISGLGTSAPLFTGPNAMREYNASFGLSSSAGVPLYEDTTQSGSYASHWSTNVIGTEIMSVGWDTTSTALRPFSRITVGAMHDIGYKVNYAAADPYTRPADRVAVAATGARPTSVYGDVHQTAMMRGMAAAYLAEAGATASTPRLRAFAALSRC